DTVLILGKKELFDWCGPRVFHAIETHHGKAGAVDEERQKACVADADEVGAVLRERNEQFALVLDAATFDGKRGRARKDLHCPALKRRGLAAFAKIGAEGAQHPA